MQRMKSANQDYRPPSQWTMEGYLYVQEKRKYKEGLCCCLPQWLSGGKFCSGWLPCTLLQTPSTLLWLPFASCTSPT